MERSGLGAAEDSFHHGGAEFAETGSFHKIVLGVPSRLRGESLPDEPSG